jgi:hypothetical protein
MLKLEYGKYAWQCGQYNADSVNPKSSTDIGQIRWSKSSTVR